MRCGTTTFNRDAHVRLPPPRAESLGEFRFGDAEVRILPPQPASQSLTHTESGRARNATKWRHFALTPGLRVRKLLMAVGFRCPVSEGDILVSRFWKLGGLHHRYSTGWFRNHR